MIDMHIHILPGIDDGAETLSDSLAMASLAVDSGTTAVLASSHGNIGDLTIAQYQEAFEKLAGALRTEGIPLQLYPGMEIFMDHHVMERLSVGELLTVNRTDYVLVEFDFEEELWMVRDYLQLLQEEGYLPIIAHAERYSFVQRHPEEVYHWVRQGIVIQVNKGSLLGAYGRRERETALSLLSHRLVHVIASDAHGTERRTPKMQNAVRFLSEAVSAQYRDLMLTENPGRILRGEEILAFEPRPYRQNRYW